MAAGGANEESKSRKPPKKPMAFTEEPASSNAALMDYEAKLLMKAGKKPPQAAPTRPPVAPPRP